MDLEELQWYAERVKKQREDEYKAKKRAAAKAARG